ncbi:uncharacterized protein LOC123525824 [Mercenaria mercenaria]|uniref:uncharacterized protein LOC123525824 n=1 Tax=Mercenaria mercenaria TaxID=6596 RepID=UPI00234EAB06|nr:uncharacterized protein LOC123525824 [Mercenaria mercenaria]XP_053394237.1 uncharacterized protein LOC123525824 [Mercenaria mercenaria]XP_053394238.1 uncharacterized protein LOC123525824 [Mercenaria mercenaria]
MSDRNIRHVEDVFGGRANGVGPHKSQNILDRKSSFNMFKNKQAPRPPTGQMPMPKIGNYQPKILLERTPGGGEPQLTKHEHREIIHHAQVHNNAASAPLIMGDKDVPLRIENDVDELNDDTPVPAPRLKRRAPTAPEVKNSEPVISNPLFGRPMSQRSDEERFEMDLEEQGGDIDFGHGLDNPGFHSRERKISGLSRDRSDSEASWIEEEHQRIQREHMDSKKGITYPYIPPPDYEDEEMTMDFEEDYEPVADYNRNGSSVYRELEGDDFGKYMQEDDYEFDAPNRPLRGPPPGGHGGHFMQNRARPVPRTAKSNRTMDKKVAKSKKKHAPSEPTMKRNTIRDFTFSDSKIGWGDRTVKSTSAKGRYIKHNKDRMRIDNAETFGEQKDGPGSYEEFLRVKNGLPLESPNSSDSGVDTGEERHHRDMYLHSQPKQMRNGKYEHRPSSVWQRLTWKFRKNPNAHRIESERL